MKGTSSCRLVECCGGVDDGRAAALAEQGAAALTEQGAAALTEQGAAGLFWAKRKLVGWFGQCLCGAKGGGGFWVFSVVAGICGGGGWGDKG